VKQYAKVLTNGPTTIELKKDEACLVFHKRGSMTAYLPQVDGDGEQPVHKPELNLLRCAAMLTSTSLVNLVDDEIDEDIKDIRRRHEKSIRDRGIAD
jgi:hypothetical protein